VDKKIISARKFAQIIGVTPPMIKYWQKNGKLVERINPITKRVFFLQEDVDFYKSKLEKELKKESF
jgi:DNA-binding transcriptional MerR regulator